MAMVSQCNDESHAFQKASQVTVYWSLVVFRLGQVRIAVTTLNAAILPHNVIERTNAQNGLRDVSVI